MGARYLTDLADVLRRAGLAVVELDGWQTRSRSSGGYDGAPWAVIWHHTASAGDGASDAHYCTHVSDNRPVCNLVIGRDGTVYVCAAGATNTNGKGGPYTLPDGRTLPLDGANSRVIGVELSNDGVGMAYPQAQVDAAFAASNAMTAAYVGRVDHVLGHVDWAPGRKIDPATAAAVQGPWRPTATNSSGSWAVSDLRAECTHRAGSSPPPPPQEDDMPVPVLLQEAEDDAAPTFWWDGTRIGALNTLTQSSVGLVCGLYQQQVPLRNFKRAELNAMIRQQWADQVPPPPGYGS